MGNEHCALRPILRDAARSQVYAGYVNLPAVAAPRDEASHLHPRAPARHPDHGRDHEQYDRDEEDDLGDFDGGAGEAAKAQNACDQRDNQKT
jgi:hypothetical protein